MVSHSKVHRTFKILQLFAGFLLEIAWYKLLRKLYGARIEARLPQLYRNQAIRFRETALALEGIPCGGCSSQGRDGTTPKAIEVSGDSSKPSDVDWFIGIHRDWIYNSFK